MNWLLFGAGVFVVGLVWADALVTTISQRGGGPLTSLLTRGLWMLAHWTRRHGHGRARSKAVELLGPTVVVLVALMWFLGLWGGWLLVFSASTGAVVDATTRFPADLGSRAYFVGFSLWTLGTGTYVPVGDGWELLTALASLQGFAFITLGVTYLLQVLQAVSSMRQLAGLITDLGGTPGGILRQNWSGDDFGSLDSYLSSLTQMVEIHGRRHLAYPVLRYFWSAERRTAFGPAFAALSEALLLLRYGVARGAAPAPASLLPLHRAIGGFLNTVGGAAAASGEAPPPPDRTLLEEAGIPIASDARFAEGVAAEEKRRRVLLALLQSAAWDWSDVSRLQEGED